MGGFAGVWRGPSVHLGSALGSEVGRLFRLSDYERKLLYTTVGGAGLAVAFNAPVGGALFTMEEVTRSFRLRIVLITLVTTSVAVGVARYLEPDRPEFTVPGLATPPLPALLVYAAFGLITGFLGVAYNAVVVGMLRQTDKLRVPAPARGAVIGAVIGLLLWINPLLAGGGDDVASMIVSGETLALGTILSIFVVRFFAGPLSYATGAPGACSPRCWRWGPCGECCFTSSSRPWVATPSSIWSGNPPFLSLSSAWRHCSPPAFAHR